VNSPYPKQICAMSSSPTPAAVMMRAMISDHMSRSFFVYPTTVGLPVVPDDACMRTIFDEGTANIPNG